MHRAKGDSFGGSSVSSPAFVRRLGEAGYGPEDGRVGALDLLARSGLPVPRGFVLTAEGHRQFLRVGGLGEMLEREIRTALLDLGTRTVSVWWEFGARRGLGTIPAVVAAVREAWTPASTGGEMPTWPVLVQRQAQPEYTGWTTTADLRPGRPLRRGVPLHDVEPAAHRGRESISDLTERASPVFDCPVRLGWGLEEGRWLLVYVEKERDGQP